ncbi:LIM domain protein 2-like protein [Dinothrombium tinctorium]|uniref:LIM domain protein 2-like protein n=1 Tax=Dinothrombium tinctorium TaxID=1965070 RepID=A0A443Q9M9_9ACAR|nr:LIM domain protein 2-like protein [Dinothrombium tinctorium]
MKIKSNHDLCKRCGEPVFLAEKIFAAGFSWHKLTCFRCKLCKNALDSLHLTVHDDEIFCSKCHVSLFNPCYYNINITK